jgi:hypothetical protein
MNPKDKILFFHIMKTGGTTLTLLLDKQFNVSQLCPARHWYEMDVLSSEEVNNYTVFRGHFNFSQTEKLVSPPLIITALRNPVDRVISEYLHWRRAPEGFLKRNPAYGNVFHLAKKLTLAEFIGRDDESGFFINNRQAYQLALPNSMPRASTELTPQQVLEKAKENLEKFSIVGTMDEMQKTAELLCYRFNWMPPASLPNVRASIKDAVSDVSPELQKELEERNSLDLQLYEYASARIKTQHEAMLKELRVALLSTVDNLQTDIHQALHARYEKAYKADHPNLLNELELTFDQAICGGGWYERQFDLHNKLTWRWTGPGPVSTLDLPLADDQDLRISVNILKVADSDLLKNMKIRVNDISLPIAISGTPESQICAFDAPVSVLQRSPGRTRISIEIDKTVKIPDRYPDSYINAGLAVGGIKVIPLKSSPPLFGKSI